MKHKDVLIERNRRMREDREADGAGPTDHVGLKNRDNLADWRRKYEAYMRLASPEHATAPDPAFPPPVPAGSPQSPSKSGEGAVS